MLLNFYELLNGDTLDRYYLAGISRFYPASKNAFEVQQKRCQSRRMREAQQRVNPLLVFDMQGIPVSHEQPGSQISHSQAGQNSPEHELPIDVGNVVSMLAHKESHGRQEALMSLPNQKLTWQVHYLRTMDDEPIAS